MKFKLLLIGLFLNLITQPAQAIQKDFSLYCSISSYGDCIGEATKMDTIAKSNCGCSFIGGGNVIIQDSSYEGGQAPWPLSQGYEASFTYGPTHFNDNPCDFGNNSTVSYLRSASARELLQKLHDKTLESWVYNRPSFYYRSYISMSLRGTQDGTCDLDDDGGACPNGMSIRGLPFLRINVKC